jgi:signal transduction histidine kinase
MRWTSRPLRDRLMSVPRPAVQPEERLLRRTRIRLAAFTMVLVATLLAAVGVVTALAAVRLMDENVDRAMDAALQSAIQSGADHDDTGSARTPSASDTFVLFLDASGQIVGNPSRIALGGLPDAAAMAASSGGADDRRDGTYGGVPVRLLTRQVSIQSDDAAGSGQGTGEQEDSETASAGSAGRAPVAAVQVGFVLSLYEEQRRELLAAIGAAALLGILGAGVVTLLVTHRALAPIRSAFEAERRFVAAASHELRTPVAIIRASAEIMQREDLATPDGATLVTDIVAETDRLGRLVGDLLALASAEAGAIAIDARPMDLGGWLEELARRTQPMVEAHGLTLECSVDAARDAVVVADADRLTQLLLVLIDNAIAHSPDSGAIHLDVVRDGPRSVAISVTDDGPGVPVELRETIFEPFARARGGRRSEGSGLGLAIARQLAVRQGGTLELAPADGRPARQGSGACFVLRMPLVAQDEATHGRPVPGHATQG